jgi:hypothetical protein
MKYYVLVTHMNEKAYNHTQTPNRLY